MTAPRHLLTENEARVVARIQRQILSRLAEREQREQKQQEAARQQKDKQ